MTMHATAVSSDDQSLVSTGYEDRIAQAEQSIREMLGMSNLQDKRFLDIGSGSGLFSLATRRLGAVVHSL